VACPAGDRSDRPAPTKPADEIGIPFEFYAPDEMVDDPYARVPFAVSGAVFNIEPTSRDAIVLQYQFLHQALLGAIAHLKARCAKLNALLDERDRAAVRARLKLIGGGKEP
jgi:hypothetical protein